MTAKPHLPITMDRFDALVMKLAEEANRTGSAADAAAACSDEELLIMVEVDDVISASEEGRAIRAQTAVWDEVMTAIRAEFDRR